MLHLKVNHQVGPLNFRGVVHPSFFWSQRHTPAPPLEVQNLEYEQKEAKRQVGDTKDNDLQKECLGVFCEEICLALL